MAVVSIPTLKTYFETGDFPTQSQFVDLIDTLATLPNWGSIIGTLSSQTDLQTALNSAATLPYKVYIAIISQSSTNTPTAVVFQNTLGVVPTFSRSNPGEYQIVSTGAFPLNKVWVSLTNGKGSSSILCVNNSSDNGVEFFSFRSTDGVAVDDAISKASIEIRVYP